MTVEEAVRNFEISYEVSAGAPGYEPEELSSILTKAQLLIVKELAPYYDLTEEFRKGLSPLYRREELTPNGSGYGLLPNGELFTTKENIYRVLMEEVKTKAHSCVNDGKVHIKPMKFDRIKIHMRDPFEAPDYDTFWRTDQSDTDKRTMQIVTPPDVQIEKYIVHYIKKPEDIVYTGDNDTQEFSELDDSMYDAIIENAVRIATGNTYLDRYQIKSMEQQRNT